MEINIGEILDRLYNVCGAKNDTQLAQVLNVKQQTLSAWRNRNSIDWELLLKIAFKKKINLHWLIYNEFDYKEYPLLKHRTEQLKSKLFSLLDKQNQDIKNELENLL